MCGIDVAHLIDARPVSALSQCIYMPRAHAFRQLSTCDSSGTPHAHSAVTSCSNSAVSLATSDDSQREVRHGNSECLTKFTYREACAPRCVAHSRRVPRHGRTPGDGPRALTCALRAITPIRSVGSSTTLRPACGDPRLPSPLIRWAARRAWTGRTPPRRCGGTGPAPHPSWPRSGSWRRSCPSRRTGSSCRRPRARTCPRCC